MFWVVLIEMENKMLDASITPVDMRIWIEIFFLLFQNSFSQTCHLNLSKSAISTNSHSTLFLDWKHWLHPDNFICGNLHQQLHLLGFSVLSYVPQLKHPVPSCFSFIRTMLSQIIWHLSSQRPEWWKIIWLTTGELRLQRGWVNLHADWRRELKLV